MPTIPSSLPQRQGINSYMACIPETIWDVDPGSPLPFLMPLADTSGYDVDQPLEAAPIFTGTGNFPAKVDMNQSAGGGLSLGLEFVTLGRILKMAFGTTGYLHPSGATGKLHQFFVPSTGPFQPLSYQLNNVWGEATVLYSRTSGNKTASIDWGYATAGRAMYTLNILGSGRHYLTTLGGAPTDDGYIPASYFNMQMVVNGIVVIGLVNFSDTIDFNASRQDVGANSGIAGSINIGLPDAKGKLSTIVATDGANLESNFTLMNLAVNKTEFSIDVTYSDQPPDSATNFFRRRYWVRLTKAMPKIGGSAGTIQEPSWEICRSSNAKWAAERIHDNLGPFNIPAASNYGVKIDGGATITAPITTGAARTVDQIVTDLQGYAPLTAVAVVDKYMGRARITSKTKGTTSSVQVDTAVSNSVHTILGLDGVAYTGKANCPLLYELFNAFGANY